MKTKEFGAWPASNVYQGGKTRSFDEYNRSLKGDLFNTSKKKGEDPAGAEYAGRLFREYNRYPETKDLTSVSEEQKNDALKKLNDSKSRSLKQRIVQQVAVLAAGSVMVASSYNAMSQRELPSRESQGPGTSIVTPVSPDGGTDEREEPDTTEINDADVSFVWSDDFGTVYMVVKDADGETVSEVPANVTVETVPATCNKDGETIYSASAETNGESFDDRRVVPIVALGHTFNEGREITLDDGDTAMEFICLRCNERFVIKNTATEE